MADVSGHGVSAGMLMSSLQTAFHTLVPLAEFPLEVLERINRLYAHNINFTTFVTMFFGRLDARHAAASPTEARDTTPATCIERDHGRGDPAAPHRTGDRSDGGIRRSDSEAGAAALGRCAWCSTPMA